MENLKKELYCLILLEKNGIPLENLNSQYFDLVGTKINFDKSEYNDLESFVRSMSDCIVIKNIRGKKICFAIGKKEVEDLKKLIDGQKSKSKMSKRKSKTRSFKSSSSSKPFSNRSTYEVKENYQHKSNRFETKRANYRIDESNNNYSTRNNKLEKLSNRQNFETANFSFKKETKFVDKSEKLREKTPVELKESGEDLIDTSKKLLVRSISPSKLAKTMDKSELINQENIDHELINKIIFVFDKVDDSYFVDHFNEKYNKTFKDPLPVDWLYQIKSCELFDVQEHEIGDRVLRTIGLWNKNLKSSILF